MERVWFIRISDETEGPFSIDQLKRDHRITPDTLVWKAGLRTWVPVGKVPELDVLFEDPEEIDEDSSGDSEEWEPQAKLRGNDVIVLMDAEPPNPTMWLLICAVILTYMIVRLYLF